MKKSNYSDDLLSSYLEALRISREGDREFKRWENEQEARRLRFRIEFSDGAPTGDMERRLAEIEHTSKTRPRWVSSLGDTAIAAVATGFHHLLLGVLTIAWWALLIVGLFYFIGWIF